MRAPLADQGEGRLLQCVPQVAVMGALPVLRAATDPGVQGGEYYGPRGFQQSKGHPKALSSSPQSYDVTLQRRLWALSEELTDIRFR